MKEKKIERVARLKISNATRVLTCKMIHESDKLRKEVYAEDLEDMILSENYGDMPYLNEVEILPLKKGEYSLEVVVMDRTKKVAFSNFDIIRVERPEQLWSKLQQLYDYCMAYPFNGLNNKEETECIY